METLEKGKENDILADNEVIVTANAVKAALISYGYDVKLVKVNRELPNLKETFDFIFNLAEGIDGDTHAEPIIAELLEKMKIPFSGASSTTLRTIVDKRIMKEMFEKYKIPTPKHQIFEDVPDKEDVKLEFPVIVKPIHEHGSIGISSDSVVSDYAALAKKITEMKELYKQPSLVEEYIDGKEINAALLGNGKRAKVLPLSEILFTLPENIPKIVSFDAKWVEGSQEYINTVGNCPADLPEEVAQKIRKIAKKAYYIIGARDYCRVDFRVRNNVPYVLEVNANPCINPDGAGFVRSANAAGLSYHEVIYEILHTSMRRSLVHSKEEIKA